MGANASTAVPLYASGQVLDAARLNLTNAGIPVFSGTATRDAAFGGSGEKVLAEGQFVYLEDTNAVQYYDSAAWQAVGVSALTLISATAISAQTSVAIDNVFTSTYTNYLVLFDNFVASASMSLRLQWRYAGPTTQTTTYFYALSGLNYVGTTQTQLLNNGSSIFILNTTSGGSSALSQVNISGVGNSSQQPVATINTFDDGFLYYLAGGANIATARTYTGFILTSSNANNFTGNVRIYGYQKS